LRGVFLSLAAMVLCGPVLLTYVVDPLQVFRKAHYRARFSSNERYQNPGLIRHYRYDAIILGTSMAENFRMSHVNRRLGVRVLKLPIRGSTAREQVLTARLALGTGRVARVIWGVDHWLCAGFPETIGSPTNPFPLFLYQESTLPYAQYLFNVSTFMDTLKIILTLQMWEPPDAKALDTLYAWDHGVVFSAERAIHDLKVSMAGATRGHGLDQAFYGLDAMQANFEVNVLSVVDAFPHVQFDLFFPPYSILQFKFYEWQNPDLLDRLFAFRGLVIDELLRRRNVALFSFDDVEAITHKLDYYKDMAHYRPEVNEYIIDSIAAGRHRITRENPFGSIARLKNQTGRFDLARTLSGSQDVTFAPRPPSPRWERKRRGDVFASERMYGTVD
jgi:hypothetical protein